MAAAFLLVVVALASVASTQANGVCNSLVGNYKSTMLPFSALAPGDEITLVGTIDNNATGVYINLYQGPDPVWLQSDIAFHYRIDFPLNYTIYNTYNAAEEKWGAQEKSSMRTGRGQQLITTIQITENGYDVLINGAFAYHFRHRQDVRNVAAVFYYGDWTVDYIEYRCPRSVPPLMPALRKVNSVVSVEGLAFSPAEYNSNFVSDTRPVDEAWSADVTSSD